jgi:cell division transport system permease protein
LRTRGACGPPPPRTDGREVHIFLKLDVTLAQRDAVEARLRGLGLDAIIGFSSRGEAYERFAAVYCDAPELIAATRPEDLPESFVVTLGDAGDYGVIHDALVGMPGVDAVVRLT